MKLPMIASLFIFWKKVIMPVRVLITTITIPRYKLLGSDVESP